MSKPWKPSRKAVEVGLAVAKVVWAGEYKPGMSPKYIEVTRQRALRRAMMAGAKIDGVGK